MADRGTTRVLTDAPWRRLAPLVEAVRPRGKAEPHDLRRTIEAIVWRHRNGATRRAIPAELGPWWMAAQTFNRWGHLGVRERLLEVAQERAVAFALAPGRAGRMDCRWRPACWTVCRRRRSGWWATAASPRTPSASGSGR